MDTDDFDQGPPRQPFSQLYPDLFAGLTAEQVRAVDEALALGRLEGDDYTREDVADLIAVLDGRMSEEEYREKSL